MYHIIHEVDKRLLKNFVLLIIYAIVAFFLLVNGPGMFDEWGESWTIATMTYLIGVAIFIIASEKLPAFTEKYIDKEFEKPLTKILIGFLASFLGATILFIVIKDLGIYFTNVTSMPANRIPANFVFQLVIVCTSEELIFRGIVFRWLYVVGSIISKKNGWILAWIGSASLFAVFHVSVYGFSVEKLFVVFLIGIVFAWSVDRWNIGVSTGIHFAWNAFVAGITALV